MRAIRVLMVPVIAVAAACGEGNVLPPATNFTANLNGANEVPAVTSGATATATFTVASGTINYTLTISGTPTSAISVAHIHNGVAGAAGPVRVNLCGTGAPAPACPAGAGTVSGTATTGVGITLDSAIVLLRGAQTYANVHTANNGGGEIRGQILGTPNP